MGLRGLLTREKIGFSMPVNAPLYPSPPYLYRDAQMMIFPFVTRPEAAAALLPAQFEVPETATAGLVFASYPWSTLGAYNEVILFVDCLDGTSPTQFAVALYVTTDAAMASGREQAGFPKKIGVIDINLESAYVARLERPAGLLLVSATMRPETKVEGVPFPITLNYQTLRVIPSPDKGAGPSLADLVKTTWVVTSGEMWTGPGSFAITGASALDPFQALPKVEALPARFLRGELLVGQDDPPGTRPF